MVRRANNDRADLSMVGPIIIRSVKLNNILSHVQTYVELPLGMTAFVGPNGAGKSSIIDSIVYALFVQPQNIKGLRGSGKKSLLRLGASVGSIEVELSVGGKRYAVYRGISIAKGEEAILYEVTDDGRRRVLASGVQPVLDYIRKLLSIPSAEAVRYTVISRQNEVAKLLEEISSVRREIILKLLGLGELEKAKDIMKYYLDQVSNEKSLLDKLKIDVLEVRKKIEEIRLVLENDKALLKKLEEEAKNIDENIKLYEKIIKLVKDYGLLSKAKTLINELKTIEQIMPICRDILSLDLNNYISMINMLEEWKKDVDEALKKLVGVEDRIRMLKDGIRKDLGIDIPFDDPTKIIEYLDGLIRKINFDKALKQAELTIATTSINIIEESIVCPLCGRDLDESLKEKIKNDMRFRIGSVSEEVRKLDQFYTKIRKYLDEFGKIEKLRLELQARIENSKRYINEYLKKLKELKNRVDDVLERVKSIPIFSRCINNEDLYADSLKCLQKLAIEISKAYEEKKSVLKQLLGDDIVFDDVLKRYKDIEEELQHLGVDVSKPDIVEIETKYMSLINMFNDVKERMGKVRGRIEGYTKILTEFLTKEKELEEKLSKLKKSEELYPVLDFIVNKLLGKEGLLAKILTAEARRLMEKYTNMVLRELNIDFNVRIDESFDIEVYTSYGALDIKSLSGGELTSLAIALRIALAYTVFGRLPGFFIFDEPTQFLDLEKRKTIFEIVRKLSERIPQVIVVTHDPEVEELADKVYYVSKEGGRSVVKEKIKTVEVIF